MKRKSEGEIAHAFVRELFYDDGYQEDANCASHISP